MTGATERSGSEGAILLTGWRGNTGSAIVRRLRARFPNRQFLGLHRGGGGPDGARDDTPPDVAEAVQSIEANLDDPAAVEAVFAKHGENIGLVVHIAHITYTPLLLRLADTYRVPRAILIHTTGIYSRLEQYTTVYRQVEKELFASPPHHTVYTVLRPTMIYGTHRDRNMHKLILHLSRKRWIPIFGNGGARMQPVHVEDVAQAVTAAIDAPMAAGRAYDLSGGSEVTYREAVDLICQELGASPFRLPIPLPLALALTTAYNRVSKNPRVTVEQVERLTEDKCYPHEEARRDLGFAPRSFADGIREEIALMRSLGLI